MLMIITTNNASHIAISIPTDVADKALPAIANMFENNATFLQNNYSGIEVIKPTIEIHLGNEFKKENYESEFIVKTNDSVLTEDFITYSPEVSISNKKALESKDKEILKLRAELNLANNRIEFLTSEE